MIAVLPARADNVACAYSAARDPGGINVRPSGTSAAFEISGIGFDLEQGAVVEPQAEVRAAKVHIHDFTFTKKVDKASAALLVMAAAGTPFTSVSCSFYAEAQVTGIPSSPYLTAVVTDAKIKRFKTQNSADGTPEMSVTFEYRQLEWKF